MKNALVHFREELEELNLKIDSGTNLQDSLKITINRFTGIFSRIIFNMEKLILLVIIVNILVVYSWVLWYIHVSISARNRDADQRHRVHMEERRDVLANSKVDTILVILIRNAFKHQGWGQVQLTKYSSTPSTRNIYQVQVLVKYSFFLNVLKYIKYFNIKYKYKYSY